MCVSMHLSLCALHTPPIFIKRKVKSPNRTISRKAFVFFGWGVHIVACYMDKKTNNFLLIFICLRGKKDFLSANIFCGVFEKKKKQWKEWKTWKIHILNSWTKTASSFFFLSAKPFPFRIQKKKPQLDIGVRTKFSKKYIAREHAWNSHW